MARILFTALLASAALAAGCGGDDEGAEPAAGDTEAQAAGEFVTFDLQELNNSGVETGTASLAQTDDGQTRVVVEAKPDAEPGDTESPPHPAHIHAGSCDELGEVVYPLDDVNAGLSQTIVDAQISELLDGDFAINVHKSADEIDVYIACGNIPDEAS